MHIGTTGWSYKHWRDLFYPHRLASTKWLGYYAGCFQITGINTSFYHSPTDEKLHSFALKFKNRVKHGHEIRAFFNNYVHGYATGDTRRLMEWVKR